MTVYFARAVGTDRIKIGYVQASGADGVDAVARRMQQLGWMFGTPVELIVTTEGKRRLERWFHQRHAAAALGRYEWFRLTPELAADIATLRANGVIDGQPPLASLHYMKFREWRAGTSSSGKKIWHTYWGFSLHRWRKHLRHPREAVS